MKRNLFFLVLFLVMVCSSPSFVSAKNEAVLQIKSFKNAIEINTLNHEGKTVVEDLDQDRKVVYEGFDQKIVLYKLN